jgi:hypothetical protein
MKTDHERLSSQNESFRNILIALAAGLDKLARRAPHRTNKAQRPITDLTIFPPSEQPWKDDGENARSVLHKLLQTVETAMQNVKSQPDACETVSEEPTEKRERAVKERLEAEIVSLRGELGMQRFAALAQTLTNWVQRETEKPLRSR